MLDSVNQTILLGVICLLLIWLIYRIRRSVKLLVQNEVFKNFPTIKDAIDNFDRRIQYLKIEMELLEKKVKEMKAK